MPARLIEPLTALLFALAIVAGGMGGGAVASIHIMRGKRMHVAMFMAYVIVGGVFGSSMFLFAHYFGFDVGGPESVMRNALIFSTAGIVLITSKDFGVRWTLQKLGWKMTVNVYREKDKGKDNADEHY